MNLRFYHCEVCGKVIAVLSDTNVPTICCGRTMKEYTPKKADISAEKHVPVFSTSGNNVLVQVGSTPHPMEINHSITWIGVKTNQGFEFRELKPGQRPAAVFLLRPEDRVEAVYAFCNVHGLWYSENESGT